MGVDPGDRDDAPAPLAAYTWGCEEAPARAGIEGRRAGIVGLLLVVGSLIARRSGRRPETVSR